MISLIDFWDKISIYPDQLTYYDEANNIQDNIFDKLEMDAFIRENAHRNVTDFEVCFDTNYLFVRI